MENEGQVEAVQVLLSWSSAVAGRDPLYVDYGFGPYKRSASVGTDLRQEAVVEMDLV